MVQGVTKRSRLSWLTNRTLVYEPICGGRGGGVAGSQPVNKVVHTGAQINFGDLPPYLTYEVVDHKLETVRREVIIGKPYTFTENNLTAGQ